jgi:hypothetical protein
LDIFGSGLGQDNDRFASCTGNKIFDTWYFKFWKKISQSIYQIISFIYKITHAIKRYVKLGYDITSGEKIEDAMKDLAGTHVAHIQPNRSQGLWLNWLTILSKIQKEITHFIINRS